MQLKLLLVAVAVPSHNPQQASRVILNPSGSALKPSSAVTINEHMKGFFICQSQDDAKRVLYYCDSCHGNVTDVTQINECGCANKGEKTTINDSVQHV